MVRVVAEIHQVGNGSRSRVVEITSISCSAGLKNNGSSSSNIIDTIVSVAELLNAVKDLITKFVIQTFIKS